MDLELLDGSNDILLIQGISDRTLKGMGILVNREANVRNVGKQDHYPFSIVERVHQKGTNRNVLENVGTSIVDEDRFSQIRESIAVDIEKVN